MAFKYPTERIPFSMNPTPGVPPLALVEREVRALSTETTGERYRAAAGAVTRRVVSAFWEDVGAIRSSAVVQCCSGHAYHEAYRLSAKVSRQRIERERATERASRIAAVEQAA
jgi:hypothetical protein